MIRRWFGEKIVRNKHALIFGFLDLLFAIFTFFFFFFFLHRSGKYYCVMQWFSLLLLLEGLHCFLLVFECGLKDNVAEKMHFPWTHSSYYAVHGGRSKWYGFFIIWIKFQVAWFTWMNGTKLYQNLYLMHYPQVKIIRNFLLPMLIYVCPYCVNLFR